MSAAINQVCLITVDGTDFKINEPSPFNPDYYSHKINHAGLRYEVGVCIMTGWIVWINGPFPCGAWPDIRIARDALHYELLAMEQYIVDGGYCKPSDPNPFARTPDGTNTFEQMQYALGRSRHENINGWFKKWNCMRDEWRHERNKHSFAFRAVAIITQLRIQQGELIFNVDYDESDF